MDKKKAGRPSGSKDKVKRKHGGGMPKKAAKDKAKVRSYSATDTEESYIKKHFISTTKLVKGIYKKELIVTKKK